jgi:glutathione S-transferase
MKIYSNGPGNLFTQSTLIAADFAKQNPEVVILGPAELNAKEFKAKNLTGKTPLLELESGDLVFESSAICQHFGRISGLNGKSVFQEAQVDQWIAFTQQNVWPRVMPVVMAAFGHATIPQSDFNDLVKNLKSEIKTLDTHLKGRSYLVGESVTTADIIASCALILPFQSVLDAGFRKGMPNVSEWFQRCMGLPNFIGRLGYVKVTEKALKAWDPNAKPEPVAAAPAKKEEKKDEVDEMDLFGDDEEEDAEAAKKAAAAAKEKA